jgi:transposase
MTEATALAARIGIDWADDHHDVCLQEAGSERVETSQVSHTPEALAEWLAELRQRFGGRPVGICLETSRGPLVHALLDHDFIVLYPVNPRTLKRFREAFAPNGAKDDPDDAGLLLELLGKHEHRLHRWEPDDPKTRALGRLVEARRKAVDLRTKLTHQLRAELKGYFPQALAWTGPDLSTQLATDFLLRWPTLEAVQRAKAQTIRKFYYGHNCRRADLIEQRIDEVRTATALTSDEAILETSALNVQMLARQIDALRPSILRYDKEISRRFSAHPDAHLFESLPGSGPAMAPRLLSAFGSQRERFQAATEVQEYSGIAPVTKRSGQQWQTTWRWGAPKFVRQSFHEYARLSIHHSAWARAYFELQRERGKRRQAAIRALAFKWIRIIYRCWKERIDYDEALYIQALIQRDSPLAKRMGLSAPA